MVEIAAMMGRSAVAWTKRGYVLPLLHSGRLVMTMPAKPTAVNQKYVVAENAATIVSIESILEYCRIPRRKGEIYAYFGTSSWQMKSIIDPMIADGRLIGSDKENLKNHWQRFVAADSDYSMEKDRSLTDYCQVPRSREELAERFGMNLKYVTRYIKPLIERGKLKMTKPEAPASIEQRYVSADTDTVILSTDEVTAFCEIPRGRKEIAERFGLKHYSANIYLLRLVNEGKLKMTIPLCPASWHQRYVRPDIEVVTLTEEALLEYCREPRTKAEITAHFGINAKMTMGKYLEPFMRSGKLRHTIPELPNSRYQRFVTV